MCLQLIWCLWWVDNTASSYLSFICNVFFEKLLHSKCVFCLQLHVLICFLVLVFSTFLLWLSVTLFMFVVQLLFPFAELRLNSLRHLRFFGKFLSNRLRKRILMFVKQLLNDGFNHMMFLLWYFVDLLLRLLMQTWGLLDSLKISNFFHKQVLRCWRYRLYTDLVVW